MEAQKSQRGPPQNSVSLECTMEMPQGGFKAKNNCLKTWGSEGSSQSQKGE